jgi:hypothetical protein
VNKYIVTKNNKLKDKEMKQYITYNGRHFLFTGKHSFDEFMEILFNRDRHPVTKDLLDLE